MRENKKTAERPSWQNKKCANRSGLFHPGFDGDRDRDIVADRLGEHRRAIHAEIGFLERGRGFPTGEHFALHAFSEAERGDLEHDFLRDAVDREVAGDIERVLAGFLPRLALERHRRELLDVEEIGGLEVLVARVARGVDGADVNRGFNGTLLEVVAVDRDGATELRERARHLADEVADLECDRRVHGVDRVGFDRGGRGVEEAERKRGGEEAMFHRIRKVDLLTARSWTPRKEKRVSIKCNRKDYI